MTCIYCGSRWVEAGKCLDCLRPALDRKLLEKSEMVGECRLWTGSIVATGYGQLTQIKRTVYAHRLAYQVWVGPIPHGYQIDHLCRNRRCIEPSHLEAITPAENRARSTEPRAVFARGTCWRGHDVTIKGSVYVSPKGKQNCRACIALRKDPSWARTARRCASSECEKPAGRSGQLFCSAACAKAHSLGQPERWAS